MLPRPLCIHKGGSAYHSSRKSQLQLLLSLYDSHTLSDTLWFCQVDRQTERERENAQVVHMFVSLAASRLSAAGGEERAAHFCKSPLSFWVNAITLQGEAWGASLPLSIHNGRKGKYLSRRNGTIYSKVTDWQGRHPFAPAESERGVLKRASNPQPRAKTRDEESNQKWTKSGPNPPSPFSLSLARTDTANVTLRTAARRDVRRGPYHPRRTNGRERFLCHPDITRRRPTR